MKWSSVKESHDRRPTDVYDVPGCFCGVIMVSPSRPTGYDVAYHISCGRSDCHITVGFDRKQGRIPRFLVLLHYQTSTAPTNWTEIARMDHNETPGQGHDIYQEGLHVDIARQSQREVHLDVPHSPLSSSRGTVIRGCISYLDGETDYIIDVYEERISPGRPPRWSPDGGEPSHTFITMDRIGEDMSRETPTEDEVLTPEELSRVLAEIEGTTPEEIESGAEELDIAPLEEATVVGYGGYGPLTESNSRHDAD